MRTKTGQVDVKALVAKNDRTVDEVQDIQLYLQFNVPFFKQFTASIIKKIIPLLNLRTFVKGDLIQSAGQPVIHVIVVYEGQCE